MIFCKSLRSNIKNNIEYISNKYQNDTDDIDLNQSGINNSINFRKERTNINFTDSFLSSKKENGADQLRRPEKNYGLNISNEIKNKFLGNFKTNLIYNHYGKHYDTHSTSFNTIELDSTDIVDFVLTKQFDEKQFLFKVNNLFDEGYQRPHGYNQDGRKFKFALNFRFKDFLFLL